MFYALREKTPLSSVPVDTERVHLVRPLSEKSIRALLSRCPHLREVGASPSVEKRLTDETKALFKEKGIGLSRVHRAGRALSLDLETIRQISELRKDFLSVRKISEKTKVPKSTIHYLIKKSKRTKFKEGKNIIYVQ